MTTQSFLPTPDGSAYIIDYNKVKVTDSKEAAELAQLTLGLLLSLKQNLYDLSIHQIDSYLDSMIGEQQKVILISS